MPKTVTKAKLSILRVRVERYRASNKIIDIDPSKPMTLVKAPVEIGLDRFIEVRDLPNLDALPFIPEKQRDFAFRYANESKPYRTWARIYGVSLQCICKWLHTEGVRAYIALTRYERRMYAMGKMLQIEKQMYNAFDTILGVKITTDNMSAVLEAAKFMWKIIHNPEDVGSSTKRLFNEKMGLGPESGDGDSRSQYATERDVTPETITVIEDRIQKLKDKIRLTDGGDGDGRPETA